MKYGYVGVSTKGQLEDNSIEEQTRVIQNLYADAEVIVESYSEAKERPLFNQILEQAQEDDYVIVTKLDRFCRSAKEGLEYIDHLMNKGEKIHIKAIAKQKADFREGRPFRKPCLNWNG